MSQERAPGTSAKVQMYSAELSWLPPSSPLLRQDVPPCLAQHLNSAYVMRLRPGTAFSFSIPLSTFHLPPSFLLSFLPAQTEFKKIKKIKISMENFQHPRVDCMSMWRLFSINQNTVSRVWSCCLGTFKNMSDGNFAHACDESFFQRAT